MYCDMKMLRRTKTMVAFFSLFFDIAIHFALPVKTRLVRPKFKRAGNTSTRVKFAGYATRRDARVGPSSLDHRLVHRILTLGAPLVSGVLNFANVRVLIPPFSRFLYLSKCSSNWQDWNKSEEFIPGP